MRGLITFSGFWSICVLTVIGSLFDSNSFLSTGCVFISVGSVTVWSVAMPTILFQSIWCIFMLRTWAMFILAFKIEICSWMDFSTQFSHSLWLFVSSVYALDCIGDGRFALWNCWTMAAWSAIIVYRSHNNYKRQQIKNYHISMMHHRIVNLWS